MSLEQSSLCNNLIDASQQIGVNVFDFGDNRIRWILEETGVGGLQLPGKDRVVFRPSQRKSLLGLDVLASAKRVEGSFKVPRPKVSSMMASMDEDVEKSSLADQDDVGSGVSSSGQNKSRT
ncbi:hypothetical protein Tco_0479538, partial [Tanacetum coccineum]